MSSRNAFENNENKTEVTREEALEYGDKVQAILPPHPEGKHYSLVNLTAGTAVIIEDDEEPGETIYSQDEDVKRITRDQFGRRRVL
jgi:hypothetical protein